MGNYSGVHAGTPANKVHLASSTSVLSSIVKATAGCLKQDNDVATSDLEQLQKANEIYGCSIRTPRCLMGPENPLHTPKGPKYPNAGYVGVLCSELKLWSWVDI